LGRPCGPARFRAHSKTNVLLCCRSQIQPEAIHTLAECYLIALTQSVAKAHATVAGPPCPTGWGRPPAGPLRSVVHQGSGVLRVCLVRDVMPDSECRHERPGSCGFHRLMIRTDARACRAIIPDPSRLGPPRPHQPGPTSGRRRPAPAGLPCRRSRPASDPWAPPPAGGHRGLGGRRGAGGARSIVAIAEWAADAPQPVRAALGARRDAPDHFAVPAEATIRRTFSCLDADALAAAVGAWLADRERERPRPAASWRRAVAVDDKTLRGAHPPDGDGRPVHLLAAMEHASRAVLAQRQVGGAPEEVTAFAPLLALARPGRGRGHRRCAPDPP
jgi:hypothetical protein